MHYTPEMSTIKRGFQKITVKNKTEFPEEYVSKKIHFCLTDNLLIKLPDLILYDKIYNKIRI